MSKKFKRVFTRTTAVLFAALLLGTSAYVPQVVQVVNTGIVAEARGGEPTEAGTTTVTTEADLISAFEAGGTVVLGSDIEVNQEIDVRSSVILDLNGHTISQATNNYGFFMVNSSLTVRDSSNGKGKIKQSNPDCAFSLFMCLGESTLTIESGSFEAGDRGGLLYVSNGTVNISGGEFVASSWRNNIEISDQSTVNISGGLFTAIDASNINFGHSPFESPSVVISGGTFVTDYETNIKSEDSELTSDTLKVTGGLFLNLEKTIDFPIETGYHAVLLPASNKYIVVPENVDRVADGTYWALMDDDTLYIFGQLPNTVLNPEAFEFYNQKENIKKIVALEGAKSGTDLSDAFWGYSNLEELYLSKLDTSDCTNFQTFVCFERKIKILDVSGLNTSSATNMSTMFYHCEALEYIDISGFDFSKVNNSSKMFKGSTALKEIKISENTTITADMELTNTQSDSFAAGWYNEDGELVSGTGKFAVISGQSGTLKRVKSNITTATISAIPDQIATGSEIKPEITVTDDTKTLVEGIDYTVEYNDNTDFGTATVTVTGIGDCVGEQTAEFNIYAALNTDEVPEAKIYVYTDKNSTAAQRINGVIPVGEGYYITSNQQLDFNDDATYTFYDSNNIRNPYKGSYTYLIREVYNPVINLIHVHDNYVTNDENILTVECKTEIGAVAVTVAELTVKGIGTYAYGEKIEIVQDANGPDDSYIDNAKKYGGENAKVEFLGRPTIAKAGTDDWSTNVPTSIGRYTAQNGVRFLGTDYYLNKSFDITAKNVNELTAMIDLDGEGDTYTPEISTNLPTIIFDGKTYTPTVSLVYNDFWNGTDTKEITLDPETDYDVDIQSGTNAGEYTITFTGKGNYTGTKTVTWDIQKAKMDPHDARTEEEKSFVYNGANTVDTALFKVSGVPEGATATYQYSSKWGWPYGNTAPQLAGSYRVQITYSKENYNDGEITLDFEITPRPVTITPVAGQKITYGELIPTTVNYTVEQANGDRGVVSGDTIDIDLVAVAGTGILNAGTYNYVLVEEDGYQNYTLSLDETSKFTVEKKPLTKDMFAVSPTELTYNGSEQSVTVTASDKKKVDPIEDDELPMFEELIQSTDWEIVNNSDKAANAGTYTVTVKATENGNYSGELTLDKDVQKWTIKGKDINYEGSDDPDSSMTVEALDKTYTGSDITETVTVKDGTKTLVEGTDYEIITVHADNKYTDAQSLTQQKCGSYTFYIVGKGNYTGENKVTWNITPADIYSVKVTGGTKTYDGKAVTKDDFRVTTKLLANKAKDANADLETIVVFKDADGTVIDAPKDAGAYKAEVTVTDKNGNYIAKTETIDFEIKKRQIEIYPAEGQSAEYGTDNENITIDYDVELANEDSNTGLISGENKDIFADVLYVDFGTVTPAPVDYYDIEVNENAGLTNYSVVYEYPVQFEITKKTITEDMFGLVVSGKDESSQTSDIEETFNGDKITVEIKTALTDADYTAAGTFSAYLPGEYTINIKGKGNYQGSVTKTWKVDTNTNVTAKTVVAEEEHTYDGTTPEVSVVADDGCVLPALSKVTYKYYQKDNNAWTELTAAPVNAGEYKVQGIVTAKGYEVTVTDAEFKILPKEINIIVDAKDLNGTYGETSYTIPYSYNADDIIDEGVEISGAVTVEVGAGDVGGEYTIVYGLTINSGNYTLVFPDGLTFTLNSKEIDDDCIVFDNASVALHDIGTSAASFKVVVDGRELVKDTDYEVAGTTEADAEGSYTVQIIGIGNYVGFAEKTWTLADDPDARAAAQAVIAENVSVTLGDDITAKLSGGKKRITAEVTGTAEEGYTITKAGFVYAPAANYDEDQLDQLVIGGEGVTNAVRNNSSSYKYGMIDNDGTGIYVRGYVVVNDGAYETVVYTDAQKLVYDDLVQYTVTVVGGTVTGTDDTTVSYTGTAIKTSKPVVRVTANGAAEGQQFYCWEKNGIVASYNETFSFYMTEKDTTVTAIYVDADEEIEKQATTYMDSITPKTDVSKIVFVTMSSVPDDCTILTSGLIFTLEEADANTLNSANYADGVRGKASTAHNYKYTWTKKYTEGETYYIRSYVKYQTADNEIKEAYGDVYKADINGFEIV